MNWQQAIDNNRDTLLKIILALLALLGLSDGGLLKTLPKFLYRRAMRIIVPAESAVRRLIMMAFYEMKLRGVKMSVLPRTRTTFTNFMLLNAQQADHVPAFNLLDPRKNFDLEAPDYASFGPSEDDNDDYYMHDGEGEYVAPDNTHPRSLTQPSPFGAQSRPRKSPQTGPSSRPLVRGARSSLRAKPAASLLTDAARTAAWLPETQA